jgi:multicomponent Na+:H+ antiporter subunit G
MVMIIDALSWVFLLTGGFLGISGGIGILRFPDFFTRLHAAGVTDTLCAALILLGLMMQAGWGLVAVKLVFITLFLSFTSPVAAHALARAALHGGLKPHLHKAEDDPSKS